MPKRAPWPVLLATCGRRCWPVGDEPAARARSSSSCYRARSAERREIADKLDRLTQREREVLAELAGGHRAQAVAEHFVVSLATVRTQIRSVLSKLEVGSQLEAVALYRRGHRAG